MLWLTKVHGIPAGMYACKIWGSITHPLTLDYLTEEGFESQLQDLHLCALKKQIVADSKCEKDCHQLVGVERVWSGTSLVLLVQDDCQTLQQHT